MNWKARLNKNLLDFTSFRTWRQNQKTIISTMPNCVEILKEKFSRSLGIPWQGILSSSTIEEVLLSSTISEAELSSQIKKRRNRFFNPIVTLWAFLYQVIDEDI